MPEKFPDFRETGPKGSKWWKKGHKEVKFSIENTPLDFLSASFITIIPITDKTNIRNISSI